jgi:murein DD-endopeptidase MepM/ murein hydrolase activator NlpD
MRMKAFLASALLCLCTLAAADDRMDFAGANDQFSSVVMEATIRPVPFAGTDGATHLDYELQVINVRTDAVTIESLEVFDAASGRSLLKLSGEDIKNWFALVDRTAANRLEASQAGYFWLDVRVEGVAPQRLKHRVVTLAKQKGLTPAATPAEGKLVPMTQEGGEVAISPQSALVLGPPLQGTGWIAISACCASFGHRRAGMPINGAIYVGQRFAIDWIKLGEDKRIVHGKIENNHDYPTYGQNAIAVADSTVASVLDGLPERTAGTLPTDTTLQNVTGNHVILDLGGSRYAFYAHLQPGSLRVKKGDRVKRGQVLALVGNSGNTSGPHLHFHVMDGLTALGAQGLPYVIDRFTLAGTVHEFPEADQQTVFSTPVLVTPQPPAARTRQYPLDNTVVDFPGEK